MACWMVGSRLSAGWGCTAFLLAVLTAVATCAARRRFRPRTPRSRPGRSRHCCGLHVERGALGVARPLAVDSSCSRTPARSCVRAWRWRAPMRPAPLILSRTAVVLWSCDGSRTSPSSASIAASSRRPLNRSCPVSLRAAMPTASAKSTVARRARMARRAVGFSLRQECGSPRLEGIGSRLPTPCPAGPRRSSAARVSVRERRVGRVGQSVGAPAGHVGHERTCRGS